MKRIRGTALKLIVAAMLALFVLGNESASLFVFAEDDGAGLASTTSTSIPDDASNIGSTETVKNDDASNLGSTESITNGDAPNLGSTINIQDQNPDAKGQEKGENASGDDSNGFGVFFYLKKDSSIPQDFYSLDYSGFADGIYISGASKNNINYDTFIYGSDDESTMEEVDITVRNAVYDALYKVPSLAEIESVYPEFDPKTQYIQWYVIKYIGYGIHVDGVVRSRVNSVYNGPEGYDPSTNQGITTDPVVELEPDLVFEFETIPGNPEDYEFECDGEEHIIGGGFTINVIDKNNPKSLFKNVYDKFGNFKMTVSAGSNGEGTTFEYGNKKYWVNIDAAYAVVKATSLDDFNVSIPFVYDGKPIDASQISVFSVDDNGQKVALGTEIVTKVDAGNSIVTASPKRSITIEAGSTVQNDNGTTLTNDTYEIVSGSLQPGHKITNIVFNGSQTGAGESSNEITSCTILDEDGNDVTSKYRISYKKGKLVLVDPNATISTGTVQKEEAEAKETAKSKVNSTGNYTSSVVNDNGQTIVINKQISYGNDGKKLTIPVVLGARKGDTSDKSINNMKAVFVIFLSLAIMCFTFRIDKKTKKH
ncbi:hypothetical protein SAMN02745247_01801 [Butyrivibrio hungatei DSM 14810]|uniref:Uncharacterized protein n=1 Tax=Butyrivibrio hungatei DSM 14810 TaxID=1121132 RepID=A0A1M7SI64_9FIRM|nr:hypothetical protein [Butyrivibrio hungatei]SHN58130.1 hypothetical protein SAMN02745247_01801 [Butyrivibrio hungatei DSM 14810]